MTTEEIGISVLVVAFILTVAAVAVWYWQRTVTRLREQVEELQRLELNEHVAHRKETTARKAAEQALKARQRFMGIVARRLRASQHDAEQQRRIIDKMADLAHYEQTASVLLKDRVPLNRFCHQVMGSFGNRVEQGVELLFETALPDHFAVDTNRACLGKVLRELIDNAVRHTRTGSIALTVTESRQKGHLDFSVRDTGPGIQGKAEGIGLTLCTVLVRLLGGTILVDPFYRDGTRITFDIKI
ncbi:MAG: HAMP domain-containing histidine kinase [Prevotella sp.]|nr:HAMP domain-containing histidine kinase [Prevotella sp.]